jgi:Ca-activated chloride channel family protein
MNYSFRFAYPFIFYGGLAIIVLAWLIRRRWIKQTTYTYSLTTFLIVHAEMRRAWQPAFFSFLKIGALIFLAALAGRPQLVDVQSKIPVEGIDIMLVLDASGSMQCFDDLQDPRTRFEVAKTEALNFAQRRENDQIGLIFFGRDAVSRCPLTLDKKIIADIIRPLELGAINPDGTALGVALAMGVRRLQQSQAKSKIIILLTDGEPTPEIDIDPQRAVELAQKCGIKIYTIGIGGEHGGLWRDPLFGIRAMGFKLNSALLQSIAQQTNGRYFEAHRPQELQTIYSVIDQLEKSTQEATLFSSYHELSTPFAFAAFTALLLELIGRLIWVVL